MTTRPVSDRALHGDTVIASLTNGSPWTRRLENKLPRTTPGFWITTLLATTLGVTTAHSLSGDLQLGVDATTAILALALLSTLLGQLSTERCRACTYWPSVVVCSAMGTMLADALGGNFGLGLAAVTVVSAAGLAGTLIGWYRIERTISVHSVVTRRREACYWAAVVCACTMGSAAQDLASRSLGLAHLAALLPSAAVVLLVAVGATGRNLPATATFWASYVTLPLLGVAIGDFLTARMPGEPRGLRPDATSVGLLVVLLAVANLPKGHRHRSDTSPLDSSA
jgi:uncharacterized membrane-anchored protein